jgi:hypothetical protein
MATTGKGKWEKYFRDREVETCIQSSAPDTKKYIYDITGTKTSKRLENNHPITVKESNVYYDSGSYQNKILIEYDSGELGYIHIDCIQKPGKKTAVAFKPQTFGVGETHYNVEDYVDLVLSNIEERNDILPQVKNYLQALMLYFSGFEDINYVQNAYTPTLPLNEIKKDYGEVIGPVAVIKQQILKPKGISIPNNKATKIYMPSRPNEPLMDYGIIVGKETFVISAKSGTATNVVKPQDIISLLAKDPLKTRKYKNTSQYKILNLLADNNAVVGPIVAASQLSGGPSVDAADNIKSRMKNNRYIDYNYDAQLFDTFIKENTYLKGRKKPTLNEIMYECEKIISTASKTTINFTDIFKDAIENQVIYVKFEIVGKSPKFEVIVSSDLQVRRVSLRSKNGYTRRSDRMGIQV